MKPLRSLMYAIVFVSAQVSAYATDGEASPPANFIATANVAAVKDPAGTMSALLSIAVQTDDTRSRPRTVVRGAVYAIAHLAERGECEQLLLRIVLANSSVTAKQAACKVLAYVGTDETRRVLLVEVEAAWKRGELHPAIDTLVEMGCDETLKWLQEAEYNSEHASEARAQWRLVVNGKLERLRIAREPMRIAEGWVGDSDPVWWARHALRHGHDRVDVHEVIVRYLRERCSSNDRFCSQLVGLSVRLGIDLPDDVKESRQVRMVLAIAELASNEGRFPDWAQRDQAYEQEFYAPKVLPK